jgi:hypothetical protein
VINVFLAVTLAGSFFEVADDIFSKPKTAFKLLGETLPAMSGFFFNYLILRACVGGGLTLLRAVGFVQAFLKYAVVRLPNLSRRNVAHVTPNGLRAFNNPGWLSHGKQYASLLLALVVMLSYAPIAPVILVATYIYFVVSWFTCKCVALTAKEKERPPPLHNKTTQQGTTECGLDERSDGSTDPSHSAMRGAGRSRSPRVDTQRVVC